VGACGLNYSGSVNGPEVECCEQALGSIRGKTQGTYCLADELLVPEVLLHAANFSRFKIFAINELTPTVSSDVVFYAEDDALSTVWMSPVNSRTQTSVECVTDIMAGALSASIVVF
jgi:hypothetical protein